MDIMDGGLKGMPVKERELEVRVLNDLACFWKLPVSILQGILLQLSPVRLSV